MKYFFLAKIESFQGFFDLLKFREEGLRGEKSRSIIRYFSFPKNFYRQVDWFFTDKGLIIFSPRLGSLARSNPLL